MNHIYRRDFINSRRIGVYNRNFFTNKRARREFLRKILGQLFICILIVSMLIIIKNINTPVTNKISTVVKGTIVKEFNYKSSLTAIGRALANFTKASRIDDFIPVFNEDDEGYSFILPLEGMIISTYGDKYDPFNESAGFQRGIDIRRLDEGAVKAIEEGVVEVFGESEPLGKYIKIRHNSKMFSLYSNLDEVYVVENQRINKGDIIGEIQGEDSYLHFELWIDGEAVDPQLYLDYKRI